MQGIQIDCVSDCTTSQGTKFWTFPKQAPRPLEFDSSDETHLSFVINLAKAWAVVCKVGWPASKCLFHIIKQEGNDPKVERATIFKMATEVKFDLSFQVQGPNSICSR